MKKPTHGGKRTGAGRKPGSGTKEPTEVRRIPVSLLPKVDELVRKHKAKKV